MYSRSYTRKGQSKRDDRFTANLTSNMVSDSIRVSPFVKNEDTKKVGNVPPRSKANEADLKKFPARMQMKRAGRQQRKTPGTTVPSVVGSQPGNEVKYSVFESEEDVTDTQIIFSQQSQDTDNEAVRLQQMKEEIGMIRILQLQLNTLKEMKREAELKYLASKRKRRGGNPCKGT